MKLLLSLFVVLMFFLNPTANCFSVEVKKDESALITNSKLITQAIKSGYGNEKYDELLEILVKLNKNPSISSNQYDFSWKDEIYSDNEYGFNRIQIYPHNFRKPDSFKSPEKPPLKIYPFLKNDTITYATLASFENKNDMSFKMLPDEIKDYFSKLEKDYEVECQNGTDNVDFKYGTFISVSDASLKKHFTKLLNTQFLVFSDKKKITVTIKALKFLVIPDWGQRQICIEFHEQLNNPLFCIIDTSENTRNIKIINTIKCKCNFPIKEDLTILELSNGTFYISDKEQTLSQFSIIWDDDKSFISYLDLIYTYCLGNEHIFYKSNTLINYKGEDYILRISHNNAELILIRNGLIIKYDIANEMAPEL